MDNLYNQDFVDNLDGLNSPKQIFDDITEWNATQDVTYWKARAMSLEIENARLKEMIHDIMIPHESHDIMIPHESHDIMIPHESHEIDEEILRDGEDLHLSMEQIHVSDLTQFVPSRVSEESQGARPKNNKKSHQKHSIQAANEDVLPLVNNLRVTEKQSKSLYGPYAAGIRGMEVALQVNYKQHLKNPETVYWPNIPLKL